MARGYTRRMRGITGGRTSGSTCRPGDGGAGRYGLVWESGHDYFRSEVMAGGEQRGGGEVASGVC